MSILSLTTETGKQYRANRASAADVSIPMIFNGAQPNTYGVPGAGATVYQDGNFIGDTRSGGSCNFEQYTLVPHCNGTHTECIGHITEKRISINEWIPPVFCLAALITVEPIPARNGSEFYTPALNPDDLVITAHALQQALKDWDKNTEALLIRTLPNAEGKKSRNYSLEAPPFFTHEAMRLLTALPIQHLLVDFPSVDRLLDDGLLSNHRIWWNHAVHAKEEDLSRRSITEMIYVTDTIKDGMFLLDLQWAPFSADASPSRPVLYPIIP